MEAVRNAERDNGLDAWRRLMRRYDPSNEHTNMALLRKVMHPPRSTTADLLVQI